MALRLLTNPGECTSGTAATFEQARREFETAWLAFLSKRTEADFEEWRQQRDWTARKYACACRKSNTPIQMMESAKKWRGHNATNGMYCSRRRRVLVD
jgi:hypothetical protein